MSQELYRGRVLAPRPGAAWVALTVGHQLQRVYAQNMLNLRTPPGSTVTIAVDQAGRYRIVGRDR